VSPLHRVTIASRVFGIAAILGLGVVSGDLEAIVTLLVVAILATTAVYVSLTTPLATAVVVTVEAAVTGLVIGLALPTGVVFLPYLVVLTLIAGISRGVIGVSAVVVVQFFSVTAVTSVWASGLSQEEVFRLLSPWLLTNIGMGLLGTWLRSLGVIPQRPLGDRSYESAHRLLTQLRTVARRLSSGLDPVTIGNHVAEQVSDTLGAARTGILVRTDGGVLSPLAFSDEAAAAELSPAHPVVEDCWAEMEPIVAADADSGGSHLAALPLRVGPRMIGVVLARLPGVPEASQLAELMVKLDDQSLRLDTALTFDEIRSIATAEERRRLAREIHDGVAQEITSLGYTVDELASLSDSADQRAALLALRSELTRVVGELRLSIFDLRSEVVRETGLGSALSEYVRQVGSRSALTVHLSLDEAPTRLRAETEAELLRIAQEAITNARKHSAAKNLWVGCAVSPPFARLTVRDDGSGLTTGRSDSFGLRIMNERAQRIDADLTVESTMDRAGRSSGTLVTVTLGHSPDRTPEPGGSNHVDVRPGDEDRLARR
jgi:signal transduction histidine kinase